MKNYFLKMVCLVFAVSAAPESQAYLDPSTGSMIVTAIVGLFASIALAVKTYWYKLKSFFRGGKRPAAREDMPEEPARQDPERSE